MNEILEYAKYGFRLLIAGMAVYGCFIVWPILNKSPKEHLEISGFFNVISSLFGFALTVILMAVIPILIVGLIMNFFIWIFSDNQNKTS